MLNQLRPAIVSFAALTFITGAIYPAIVTGIARIAFPKQASGSLVERDGKPIGSRLIGQNFTDAKYFWPRPSSAGPAGYDASSGSGSNLGPNNPALSEAVKARITKLGENDSLKKLVPVDLITASASGLDPHISPTAAEMQVPRIAAVRRLSPDLVRRAIAENTEQRTFGLLGEARVNVLELNMLLDAGDFGPAQALPSQEVMGWRGRAFLPESK